MSSVFLIPSLARGFENRIFGINTLIVSFANFARSRLFGCGCGAEGLEVDAIVRWFLKGLGMSKLFQLGFHVNFLSEEKYRHIAESYSIRLFLVREKSTIIKTG
jgi:hypothetical protein